MGICIEPTINNTSVEVSSLVIQGTCSLVVQGYPDETTNREQCVSAPAICAGPTPLDTMRFAVSRYDSLLRKLAD